MTNKHIPLRKCVGCGESKPKVELYRILRTDEKFILDKSGKLAGRGAYICPNKECFELAEKKRGLEKSFRQGISKEIYESLRGEFIE